MVRDDLQFGSPLCRLRRCLSQRIILGFIVALSVVCCVCPPASAQRRGTKLSGVALIVGNDYYSPGLDYPSLHLSVRDAEAVKKTLIERFGYSERNVIYVLGRAASNGMPVLDTNAVPRRDYRKYGDKVTTALINQAESVLMLRALETRSEHVLLYVSGHGTTVTGKSVFVCGDGTKWDIASAASDLSSAFSETRKGTIVGLFDVGRQANRRALGSPAPTVTGSSIFIPIFGCQNDQSSDENASDTDYALSGEPIEGESDIKFHHSLFTYALLKSLEKGALTRELTVKAILSQADATMRRLRGQAFEMNRKAHASGQKMEPYSRNQQVSSVDMYGAFFLGRPVVIDQR